MNKFAKAKKVMGEILLKPKGKGQDWDDCGYRANIAMLLYDDQRTDNFDERREPPTHLGTVEGCNSMADRIIRLIFT